MKAFRFRFIGSINSARKDRVKSCQICGDELTCISNWLNTCLGCNRVVCNECGIGPLCNDCKIKVSEDRVNTITKLNMVKVISYVAFFITMVGDMVLIFLSMIVGLDSDLGFPLIMLILIFGVISLLVAFVFHMIMRSSYMKWARS